MSWLARVKKGVEQIAIQPVGVDGRSQWRQHLVIALAFAARRLVQAADGLAPPLQADPAQHRLAHHLAASGDFKIECGKGEQGLATVVGREHRAQEAVAVKTTCLLSAV